MRRIWIGLLGLLVSGGMALAQSDENLLKNGDIQAGAGRSVPGWTFSDWNLKPELPRGEEQAKVTDWGVKEDEKGRQCLWIGTSAKVQSEMWWQQEVKAEGGSTYALSFRSKGSIQEMTWGGFGVLWYFLGQNNDWLGVEKIPVELSDDWKTWTSKVTIPDNAVKVGVRLGIVDLGIINVFFEDVVLTKESDVRPPKK